MKNLAPQGEEKIRTAWNIKHDSKRAIQNRERKKNQSHLILIQLMFHKIKLSDLNFIFKELNLIFFCLLFSCSG